MSQIQTLKIKDHFIACYINILAVIPVITFYTSASVSKIFTRTLDVSIELIKPFNVLSKYFFRF